jgi:hypothetical protein
MLILPVPKSTEPTPAEPSEEAHPRVPRRFNGGRIFRRLPAVLREHVLAHRAPLSLPLFR